MKETDIQSTARIQLSKLKLGTYFRANVGQGWQGKSEYITKDKTVAVSPGDVVLRKARTFNTGLPKGFPDVFGFTFVQITPGMVGKKVPWFTGLEFKTDKGKSSPEQIKIMMHLKKNDCIGGTPRSVEDAIKIVTT